MSVAKCSLMSILRVTAKMVSCGWKWVQAHTTFIPKDKNIEASRMLCVWEWCLSAIKKLSPHNSYVNINIYFYMYIHLTLANTEIKMKIKFCFFYTFNFLFICFLFICVFQLFNFFCIIFLFWKILFSCYGICNWLKVFICFLLLSRDLLLIQFLKANKIIKFLFLLFSILSFSFIINGILNLFPLGELHYLKLPIQFATIRLLKEERSKSIQQNIDSWKHFCHSVSFTYIFLSNKYCF